MRTQYYHNFRLFLGDDGPSGHGHGDGWAVIDENNVVVGFVPESAVDPSQHLDAEENLPAYVAVEMMIPRKELEAPCP